MYKTKISGVGSFLPEKVMTNYDLEKMVETSHDWIVQRTGIERRHIIADGEGTSDMIVRAAQSAIADAKMTVENLDLIIVATLSGDFKMPATACVVQAKLGAKKLDMIIANQVGVGLGFDVDDNQVTVLTKNMQIALERTHKTRLAGQLIAIIAEHLQNVAQ